MIFSWLLTIDLLIFGADASLFGAFLMVLYQLKEKKSATGLSLQSLSLVVLARLLHLLSHPMDLHFEPTMIPIFVYSGFDVANACFGCYVLYFAMTNLLHTYEAEKDTFGEKIFRTYIWPSAPVTGIQRVFVRSGFSYFLALSLGFVWWLIRRSHQSFFSSYFACIYEVLGAVALLPQLWMFQKDKVASPQLANFVVLVALNRFFTLAFWTVYPWVFHWRYPDNRGIQMLSEVLNLFIISDFLYYYVRAKLRGENYIKIPTSLQEDV